MQPVQTLFRRVKPKNPLLASAPETRLCLTSCTPSFWGWYADTPEEKTPTAVVNLLKDQSPPPHHASPNNLHGRSYAKGISFPFAGYFSGIARHECIGHCEPALPKSVFVRRSYT